MLGPTRLDHQEIATAVRENNMGIGGIELRVRGTLEQGRIRIAETGQELPVSGAPTAADQPWLLVRWDAEGCASDRAVPAWLGAAGAPTR